ncbi:restriction endonuclease subunit S [Enterococcus faecium]
MSNDTQPEIRFPGFTEDWEQRKLGKLYKTYSGMTPLRSDSSNFENPTVPWIKTTDLRNTIIRSNEEKISDKAASKLRLLPVNTVLIAMYGGFNQIGRTGLLTYPATINQALTALEPIEEITSYFLITELNYRVNDWKRLAASSRKDPNITKKDVENFRLFYPLIVEQQKIGSFFQQLDHTIALQQRKLDLLKETKKGFLQKMFPKNGAKVPEIRFPGFTEDWEERRLQEVVDRYDNLRIPITASKRVAGNTPYYGANGIQGYVEGYTHDGEFILVAEDGANDLKNYPVQYVDGKVWVNNHAHVIQAKENLADNMFLMNAIRSINIEPFLVGGGRAKLNADVLMKLEVIIPLKSEQQKIGAFFKQLDDTIALHQRELDVLKETKKGFLQKMFV